MYSRILGQTEPYWYTIIEINKSNIDTIEDDINKINRELNSDKLKFLLDG